MLVINASNHIRSHGNPYIFYEVANSALLPDVTERCYQVNIIYQISLI